MKKIILPLVIIFVIITIITVNQIVLYKITQSLNMTLETAMSNAKKNDFDACLKNVDDFTKDYENSLKYMYAMIRHTELDQIRISAKKLETFAKEKERVLFLAECNVTMDGIFHLYQADNFNLANIF